MQLKNYKIQNTGVNQEKGISKLCYQLTELYFFVLAANAIHADGLFELYQTDISITLSGEMQQH